ncbi:glycosyltransferase [Roseateles depolymerans]|uniref:Glycosyltransferase n=1 Tax=Roseateles depolymerans TaxID=76731 RepID=A0A0U3LQX7_9BURK|nr:glycosyltransferase [Roseateles depolymerans]ALV07399.1 glycosyltransferase [Roseateles depolymerans]REG22387.1 glycosyl transferase family 4 [Roseateles depolymerans]
MKRVLMISFQFPPMAGTSGVQRALRFAQQLPEEGWTPSVLTVHPRAYEQTAPDLLDEVPQGLTVRRAFGLDAARQLSLAGRYPGVLARPDRWTSWWLGAVPAGLAMIRRERPDVIWSTYPIPTAHCIADTLARLSGLPWVADFRDPMAHDGYPADPVLWRSFEAVERRVFRRARRMTFTTPGAARLYAQRYPQAADRVRVIENGYSEEAFAAAQSPVQGTAPSAAPSGPRVLLHSGVVYPDWRSPAGLFQAIASARAAGRLSPASFQLRLRATAHDDFVRQLAAQHGVADLVQVQPALPYVDALSEMLSADGLLLLQSRDCNDQIPAKAYEYLRAGRPILTLADPAGDTAQLMRRAGLPHQAPLEDAAAIDTALHRFLEDWLQPSPLRPDAALVRSCSRRARTTELARVLDEAVASAPNPRGQRQPLPDTPERARP